MVRGVAALRTDKVKIRSRGRTIRQSRLNNYLAVTLAGYLNTMSKHVCLSVCQLSLQVLEARSCSATADHSMHPVHCTL